MQLLCLGSFTLHVFEVPPYSIVFVASFLCFHVCGGRTFHCVGIPQHTTFCVSILRSMGSEAVSLGGEPCTAFPVGAVTDSSCLWRVLLRGPS